MENEITIALPSDVPTPKFGLFERVRACVSDKNVTGAIFGMEFVDLRTALYHHAVPGWNYTVNLLYSAPEDEALRVAATENDGYVVAQEKDLVAVGVG